MSCDVGWRRGSDPMLLWLWCRPAAAVLIEPLLWEPPYATGPKKTEGQTDRQKERKKRKEKIYKRLREVLGEDWFLVELHTPIWLRSHHTSRPSPLSGESEVILFPKATIKHSLETQWTASDITVDTGCVAITDLPTNTQEALWAGLQTN